MIPSQQLESIMRPGAEKVAKKLPNFSASVQTKKLPSATLIVPSHGSAKLVTNKMILPKPAPVKAAAIQDAEQNSTAPAKKTLRPAAWLLHSVGVKMVRERVYDDLIEIQEEKDAEGQLTVSEQRQLSRLQDAHRDLLKLNKPYAVRTKHRCRCCGFSARSRLELELHRDYGSVSGDDCRYSCCLCNLCYIRSPAMMAAHIERCHGRQSRLHTLPLSQFCPYCPYEQRTVTKCKLMRHVLNCAVTFHIDRNLAPIAAEADIPLYETIPPPVSSVQTMTTAAVSDAGSKSLSSLVSSNKTSGSSMAAPALSGGCTTVSAAGPVMTPTESQPVTTAAARIPLAKLARMVQLPEGIGFEICELCGAFLASRESMVLHMSHAHKLVLPGHCLRAEKPVVSCGMCTDRFWTRVGLDVHVSQMHSAESEPASPATTVCPLCKRTRLTDVVEHLARQHRITLVDMFAQRYCSICQKSLHAARSFEHHMLTDHSDLFQDRAGLYAAIVMVDRATRGRVGIVGHGRQPAVLSGAASKPNAMSSQLGPQCPVCLCEFANDDEVQKHVHQTHGFVCSYCGRKCTSTEFLRYHIENVHSSTNTSCHLCGIEVTVSALTQHMQNCHTHLCAVSITPVRLSNNTERLEYKRHRGSESSASMDSSNDDDLEPTDEETTKLAAKKMKLL